MNYNWNWSVFLDLSSNGQHTFMETLFHGFLWTLATGVSAGIIAFFLGSVIGIAVTFPAKWIRIAAHSYIEVFRNIPLLVQMFVWYFVVPELLPEAAGRAVKSLEYGAFYTAVLSLSLYTASRIAVQVYAGINAVGPRQRMAGQAVGLTLPQIYRYVILPMVYRIIIPPLTSEAMGVIKNSAVALTIGVVELTASARAMQEYSFQTFEAFIAATLIYMGISLLIVICMTTLERVVALPGFMGQGSSGRKEKP